MTEQQFYKYFLNHFGECPKDGNKCEGCPLICVAGDDEPELNVLSQVANDVDLNDLNKKQLDIVKIISIYNAIWINLIRDKKVGKTIKEIKRLVEEL